MKSSTKDKVEGTFHDAKGKVMNQFAGQNLAPRFAARFDSATASFIAARSSAVQTLDFAVFCAMAGFTP